MNYQFRGWTMAAKANKRHKLFICDRHSSYTTPAFVIECWRNNISLLPLPLHTSHLTQSLDILVFRPLEHYISMNLQNLFHTQISHIQKVEWFNTYIRARESALMPQNIKSGFSGAEIIPFCPSKVL